MNIDLLRKALNNDNYLRYAVRSLSSKILEGNMDNKYCYDYWVGEKVNDFIDSKSFAKIAEGLFEYLYYKNSKLEEWRSLDRDDREKIFEEIIKYIIEK